MKTTDYRDSNLIVVDLIGKEVSVKCSCGEVNKCPRNKEHYPFLLRCKCGLWVLIHEDWIDG